MNAGLKIGAAVDGRSTVELTEQERRALVGVLNDLFAGAPQDPILTKRGAPERLRWLQQNLKRSLVDDVD